MNPDETCAYKPQGSNFALADYDSTLSKAQPTPSKRPPALESNEVSVLSGTLSQPAVESHAPYPVDADKVATPRDPSHQILTSKGRVRRACNPCRELKTKCSGQRPACQRCRESDIPCIYTDRKRERDARLVAWSSKLLDSMKC
jgi:hypothetical protein